MSKEQRKFKPDVKVRLRSGGPIMRVMRYNTDPHLCHLVLCCWQPNNHHKVRSGYFHESAIEEVE
jgi:uncharacterized protein YodC (DUF2158 family)